VIPVIIELQCVVQFSVTCNRMVIELRYPSSSPTFKLIYCKTRRGCRGACGVDAPHHCFLFPLKSTFVCDNVSPVAASKILQSKQTLAVNPICAILENKH